MRLPRLPRVTGPGIRQRDDDLIRCSHGPHTMRRDEALGLLTARGVYLNICPDCAHRLAPDAHIINNWKASTQ